MGGLAGGDLAHDDGKPMAAAPANGAGRTRMRCRNGAAQCVPAVENGGKRQKAREDAATRPLGMKGRAFAALRHRYRANADSFT